MLGNNFGQLFSFTTFGESHGSSLSAIIDGCPPKISLSSADLQKDLDRRKPGQSKFTSQRKEKDQVKILSGVFNEETAGMPIGGLIENSDHKSKDYENIKHLFCPGHAGFTYFHKYGIRDYKGGGRASAKETVMRVAAGVIAKKILQQYLGVNIFGYVSQIADIHLNCSDRNTIENNSFFCADSDKITELETLIHQIRKQGDSIGAKVEVVVEHVSIGFGEPVFNRLDADIAQAMMSINAVKAVGIGDGFEVSQTESEHRDEYTKNEGFLSNHAGGILGGISSGKIIIVSLAFKSASSILKPGRSVDIKGNDVSIVTTGRHDPCVGIRGVPIAEAMLALVLVDHYLRDKAQNK